MPNLIQQLRAWRAEQARIEGIEPYRVLPNATLDVLVGTLPRNKEEMLAVKGIKEAKYQKYGKVLLSIIAQFAGEKEEKSVDLFGSRITMKENRPETITVETPDKPLSVSQFLDAVNVELSGMAARIQGEVSSIDERARVVYFTLKDGADESTLNCVMFRYQYEVSGVKLAVGDEVIVEGVPEVYKPYGKFSLKVGVIELFGEGALKKAYEALKTKCEAAGLFAPEKKRRLPEFPERIALITSEQGAAIGDFTTNIGRLGMRIDFYPTSVEGKKAVFEILEAIRFFHQKPEHYDILVIVRGGGSLESLQAFNNEALICAVADSKIPTLLGIGHEKDVPLATLAADVAVSTPTAAARTLREPWEKAREAVVYLERQILGTYERELLASRHRLEIFSHNFLAFLEHFSKRFQFLREQFLQEIPQLQFRLGALREKIGALSEDLERNFSQVIKKVRENIEHCEKTILRYDPKRALALGYSLIQKEGKLLRSTLGIRKGDKLTVRLADGQLDSEVTKVYNR